MGSKIKRLFSSLLMIFLFINWLFGQQPENIDFSNGNFGGWTMEGGEFWAGSNGEFYYVWDKEFTSQNERFTLISGSESEDPIIACSDFAINPFGEDVNVLRIGRPSLSSKLEGSEGMISGNERLPYSYSERATYSFTVTEETKVLIVNFAAVLHDPSEGGGNKSHLGQTIPFFSVVVSFTNESGDEMVVPCANFESSGSGNASYLNRNPYCTKSKAKTNTNRNASEEYMFMPWTSTIYDLQDKVGWKVTVQATNHDCLVDARSNGKLVAGGHEAYGYIYSRTSDLKLETSYCETNGEDPTITAPEGFASYEWFVNGHESSIFTKINENGSKVRLSRELMTNGSVYSCVLRGELPSCEPVTISTEISPVRVLPSLEYTVSCDGEISFVNKTVVEGEDKLKSYNWDFADGTESEEENPVHKFPLPGNYKISLKGESETGCSGVKEFNVTVPYFPKMFIEAEDTVCQGKNVEMFVQNITSGSTVTWLDSDHDIIGQGAMISVEMQESNKFYIECVDEYKCKYIDSISIGVSPSPKITLKASKDVVCAGELTELSAVVEKECSFSWSNGGSGDVTKVYPGYTTTYTCTAMSSDYGCISEEEIKIVVSPQPEISIKAPEEVCDGEKAVMTGEGGVEYEWNLGRDDNGQTIYEKGESISINPKDGFVYSVIGKDARGCTGSATTRIFVKSTPVIEILGQTKVCLNETTILSATGAESYVWSIGNNKESTLSVKMDGTIDTVSVIGTRNGCVSEAGVKLETLPSPVLALTGDSLICPDGKSDITASGAATYSWGNGITGEKLQVSPSVNTKYTLVGTSDNGCTARKTVKISLREVPSIAITGEYTACKDSTAHLSASGAESYLWFNGETGSDIGVKVSDKTRVSVVGTDKFGCKGESFVTVIPVEHPELSFIGQTDVCQGDYVTLRAQGATEFEWHYGNEVVYTPNLDFIPEDDITVKLIGTLSHCASEMFVEVHPIPGPKVTITGDKIVCPGEKFTITADGAKYYKWSTNDFTPSISYSPIVSTTYYVTGTDENGCTGITEYRLEVYPDPHPDINLTSNQGCEGDVVTLTGEGGVEFEWSSEPEIEELSEQRTQQVLNVVITEDTEFKLFVKDAHGCTAETSRKLVASERKPFNFEISPGWIDASNPTVSFNGISPISAKWSWTPHSAATDIDGRMTSYTYNVDMLSDSVSVLVKAVDIDGCVYTADYPLYIWKDFFAPTAFTPNGDGNNDSFGFFGGRFVDEFSYIIYNRLGEIMFEANTLDETWDGNWDGKECPWGVYGWVCNYKCSYNNLKREGQNRGFVTLIR